MNTYKRYSCLLLIAITVVAGAGCKKFLLVEPIERLSGNVYWKSESDVEAYVNDLYARFWLKISSSAYTSAAGELRSGEISPTIGVAHASNDAGRRKVYEYLGINDLRTVLQSGQPWHNSTNSMNMNLTAITRWTEFYQVIQGANILFYEVARADAKLSVQQVAAYRAEAEYLRCLTYFFMVRIFGDVPYYTNAYQSEPLGRENFVSVLNKCIAGLEACRNDLPWRYDDAVFAGVRGTRGAALALLMNMNMWNAGFDLGEQQRYYRKTADLGKELIDSKEYQLVAITDFPRVMRGKSEEGIIEFKESADAGGAYNKFAFVSEMLVAFPEKAQAEGTYSHAYYRSAYLDAIFADQADRRRTLWFIDRTSQDGIFSMKKFEGPVSPKNFPDWSIILCRYADVLLMRAEALAELGEDGAAIEMLDMVRNRASATAFDAVRENLKDAIFIERSKELIGEGIHYYDLIRTRRILNGEWTNSPLTPSQFERGAWTWPINPAALNRNPYMSLNDYWL